MAGAGANLPLAACAEDIPGAKLVGPQFPGVSLIGAEMDLNVPLFRAAKDWRNLASALLDI